MISDFHILAQVFWFLVSPCIAYLIIDDKKNVPRFLMALLISTGIFQLQAMAMEQNQFLARLDGYGIFRRGWWMGTFLATVTAAAELAKNMLRRKIKLEEGQSWFPFDQIIWALACCLTLRIMIPIKVSFIVVAALEAFIFWAALRYLEFRILGNSSEV